MKRLTLTFALLFGSVLATAPAQAAVVRFRGGVLVAPAYRPWAWGYGPWAYGPWGYGPYVYGYPMGMHTNAGQLKIDTPLKNAQVYINGAYAGTVKEVNSMWLRQGSYQLEVRAADGEKFDTKVFVAVGKTVKVRPELQTGGDS